MKYSKALFILILTVLISFTSCKKNKEDPDTSIKSDTVEYDGKYYDISKGYIITYEEQNTDNSWDIDYIFTSSNVVYHAQEDSFSGIGAQLYLDLSSINKTTVADGVYKYTEEYKQFEIALGDFSRNIDLDKDETEFDITGGSFTKSGTKITFDFTLDNGKSLKGTYEGVPEKLF